jgi:RecA/RadA recombinase
MVKKQKDEKEKETKADKGASFQLQEAIEEIQKKFGEGSIMKLQDVKMVDVDSLRTGCTSIDVILGIGGLPRGRIIEIFGGESSGKTTLALHCIAEAQKANGVAAFDGGKGKYLSNWRKALVDNLRFYSHIKDNGAWTRNANEVR